MQCRKIQNESHKKQKGQNRDITTAWVYHQDIRYMQQIYIHNKHIKLINKIHWNKENSLFISDDCLFKNRHNFHFFYLVKIDTKMFSFICSNSHKSSFKFTQIFTQILIQIVPHWSLCLSKRTVLYRSLSIGPRSRCTVHSKYKRPSIHLVGFPRREGLDLCLYLESSHRYKRISYTDC